LIARVNVTGHATVTCDLMVEKKKANFRMKHKNEIKERSQIREQKREKSLIELRRNRRRKDYIK
jgi:hypothetical protein